MCNISIVDYGIGNLLSVQRAFLKVGATVDFVSTPSEILKAQRLVLPGVGAFKNGMRELKERNLIDSIKEFCDNNKPLLGICLGMQMLFDESEENGITNGLGIISGVVKKMSDINVNGNYQKIPHVGWEILEYAHDSDDVLIKKLNPKPYMYFVHSYVAHVRDDKNILARFTYGGTKMTAIVKKENVYGIQCHPEKSGEDGLKFLEAFKNIN